MTTVVVDASTIAAILFDEPASDAMQASIRGKNLVAPRLLRFEIVSIALKKQRSQPHNARLIAEAVARYGRFTIREIDVPPLTVLATALRSGLTAYDASYLALASILGAPLITLDAGLAAVVR